MSRLNGDFSNSKTAQDVIDFVHALCINSTPAALSTHEIECLSGADPEFHELRHCITLGDWSKCTMHSYLHVKDELCCYGQLILRGTRLVIPLHLRDRMLNLAHEGHQGMIKTKNRLQSKVWWPKMDADAKKLCWKCHGCQVTGEPSKPEPQSRVVPPSGPWQDCAVD